MTTEDTRVYRITHPTKIIETDTLSRTPESPLFHSCVEVLKVILLLIISLLLGLIYSKDSHTTITYQTIEVSDQSLVSPPPPTEQLVSPPPPTEQLASPPPPTDPPTEQLVSPPPPTEQLVSPPPPTPSPASTTNTSKEYKILHVWGGENPEGKLQELTLDGWELINGGYNYGSSVDHYGGLHTMYLSRQNATTYEYMFEDSRTYTRFESPSGFDQPYTLMRADMSQRLNELGEEGWIFISRDIRGVTSDTWYTEIHLQRPKP